MTPAPCPRCHRVRTCGTGGTLCSRCRYTLRRRVRAKREREAAPPRWPLLFSREFFDKIGS